MQSLYPAWKEAVDKYPPWVEALLSSYPPWTPTAYATGYKTWNMGTNDPQGLALALAESHYNIGNIDSFNSYIKSLETSGLIPGTKFVKKGDSLENAAPLDTASGTDGIVNLSPDTNPLIASYLLLQNGVNFWESPDPMGKLRGMCYIMAAKAQISIAKAQVLGYPADLITNAKVPAAQAFSKAKDAGTAADAKTLSSIYEIIVSATMDTVKSIGLVSPNQNKTAPVVKDPRISTLITDADAKISYVIGIISQGMTSGSQSQQIGSLRTVVQQIQTAQLAISAQNTPKPPPVIPQTPNP
jgi:hypothetical protein